MWTGSSLQWPASSQKDQTLWVYIHSNVTSEAHYHGQPPLRKTRLFESTYIQTQLQKPITMASLLPERPDSLSLHTFKCDFRSPLWWPASSQKDQTLWVYIHSNVTSEAHYDGQPPFRKTRLFESTYIQMWLQKPIMMASLSERPDSLSLHTFKRNFRSSLWWPASSQKDQTLWVYIHSNVTSEAHYHGQPPLRKTRLFESTYIQMWLQKPIMMASLSERPDSLSLHTFKCDFRSPLWWPASSQKDQTLWVYIHSNVTSEAHYNGQPPFRKTRLFESIHISQCDFRSLLRWPAWGRRGVRMEKYRQKGLKLCNLHH